jgi:hypothetical protein
VLITKAEDCSGSSDWRLIVWDPITGSQQHLPQYPYDDDDYDVAVPRMTVTTSTAMVVRSSLSFWCRTTTTTTMAEKNMCRHERVCTRRRPVPGVPR